MAEFGGMRAFNPQVRALGVAGQKPQLAGGSIKGDGNLRVVAAWNPQAEPGQGGAPSMAPAQLGDMGTPRGAQPIQLAGQPRPVQAQAQPQHALGAPEETHHFSVQATGRDGRTLGANVAVQFPAGTRIVGVLPPPPPQYQMGGQEESHLFTIRGVGPDNRESLRDIEVTFPTGVGKPIVSELN